MLAAMRSALQDLVACSVSVHFYLIYCDFLQTNIERDRLSGRGTARAEDDQGKPTLSHISPSILVYEEKRNKQASQVRNPDLALIIFWSFMVLPFSGEGHLWCSLFARQVF